MKCLGKGRLAACAAAVIVAGVAGPASADTVYDNGAPLLGNGRTFDFGIFTVADDFSLGGTTTLNGVTFAKLQNPGVVMTSVDWTIYAGGGSTPGAVITSGSTGISETFTGRISGGTFPETSVTFSLPGVILPAGNYWLGLSAHSATFGNFWENTDANASHTAAQTAGDGVWLDTREQMSFSLDDAAGAPPTGTPLPSAATAGMVLMGGLAFRRRARRTA